MSAFLRRLPLARLLLLCGALLAFGASATAVALALSAGPTPPPKPLAEAVHDALAAPTVSGVSARIQYTSKLLEGVELQSSSGGPHGGSSPLLSGAEGRLWISDEGKVRVELQSEQGDTEIFYDGETISLYDPSSNTFYRYTPEEPLTKPQADGERHIPTVAQIEEAISHIMRHANLTGAIPTDVAGQEAYAVKLSPREDGGLVGGAELAWDAVHGVPLKLAVYSSTSSSPVLELTATDVSYGPVSGSVFSFSPPPTAKITDLNESAPDSRSDGSGSDSSGSPRSHERVQGLNAVQAAVPFTLDAPVSIAGLPRDEPLLIASNHHPAALIPYGKGLAGITVVESEAKPDAQQPEASPQSSLGELPTVTIGSSKATEIPTALGTLLSFQRSGVSYLLAGSVTPTVIETAARGL